MVSAATGPSGTVVIVVSASVSSVRSASRPQAASTKTSARPRIPDLTLDRVVIVCESTARFARPIAFRHVIANILPSAQAGLLDECVAQLRLDVLEAATLIIGVAASQVAELVIVAHLGVVVGRLACR